MWHWLLSHLTVLGLGFWLAHIWLPTSPQGDCPELAISSEPRAPVFAPRAETALAPAQPSAPAAAVQPLSEPALVERVWAQDWTGFEQLWLQMQPALTEAQLLSRIAKPIQQWQDQGQSLALMELFALLNRLYPHSAQLAERLWQLQLAAGQTAQAEQLVWHHWGSGPYPAAIEHWLAGEDQALRIPIRPHGQGWLVAVSWQGTQSDWLIDSGASMSGFNGDRWQPPAEPTRWRSFRSANSLFEAPVAELDRLQIGELIWEAPEVAFYPLGADNAIGGLLGTDFLGQYRWQIDSGERILKLYLLEGMDGL